MHQSEVLFIGGPRDGERWPISEWALSRTLVVPNTPPTPLNYEEAEVSYASRLSTTNYRQERLRAGTSVWIAYVEQGVSPEAMMEMLINSYGR